MIKNKNSKLKKLHRYFDCACTSGSKTEPNAVGSAKSLLSSNQRGRGSTIGGFSVK